MGAEAAAGYAGIIGGVAAHLQGMAGELTPAAAAQRKLFRSSRNRLRTGEYGFSGAQQGAMQAQGNQQVQAAGAQQGEDIARAQAAGLLGGGASTEAIRTVAGQQVAGRAQVAGQVQQASNLAATQQYADDQARVDAQADRRRAFWREQGKISMQTTQGKNIGEGSEAIGDSMQWKPSGKAYGAQPAPATTIPLGG